MCCINYRLRSTTNTNSQAVWPAFIGKVRKFVQSPSNIFGMAVPFPSWTTSVSTLRVGRAAPSQLVCDWAGGWHQLARLRPLPTAAQPQSRSAEEQLRSEGGVRTEFLTPDVLTGQVGGPGTSCRTPPPSHLTSDL